MDRGNYVGFLVFVTLAFITLYPIQSHVVPLRPPTASLFEAITIVTITIVPVTTIPVTIDVNRPGHPTNIHEQCHLPQYKRSYQQTLSERLSSRVFFLQSTIHIVKLSLYSTHHTTIRYPRGRYLSIRRTSPCKRVSTTSFVRSQSLSSSPPHRQIQFRTVVQHSSTLSKPRDTSFLGYP